MRTTHTRASRSILAILASIVVTLSLAACIDPELPSDDPTASPAPTPSPAAAATPAGSAVILIDGPVALADLLATIESAYEIGHPNVDLVMDLHDEADLQARLVDAEPADIFVVDAATGAAGPKAAVSTQDPLAFSTEYVALLADRSAVGGPVLSFLSWLLGPDGRAIVTSAGLTPPS